MFTDTLVPTLRTLAMYPLVGTVTVACLFAFSTVARHFAASLLFIFGWSRD